jgi:hypothetical protein
MSSLSVLAALHLMDKGQGRGKHERWSLLAWSRFGLGPFFLTDLWARKALSFPHRPTFFRAPEPPWYPGFMAPLLCTCREFHVRS